MKFKEDFYIKVMEYQVIKEFNLIRGKEFILFEQFSQVHDDAQKKVTFNFVQKWIAKLKQGNKTNVIIVSGIPGSSKGRLSEFLQRQLTNEGVKAVSFKLP